MNIGLISLIVYLSVFGGAIGVLGKISVSAFSPLTVTFLRVAVSLIFLIFIFSIQKKMGKVLRLVIVNWKKFLALAVFGVGVAMIVGFIGVDLTTAINYGLIYNLSPIFILLFAVPFLREKMRGVDFVFICLAFLGAGIIVTNGQSPFVALGRHLVGDLLVLASAVGWALYSVIGTKFSRERPELDSLTITFGSFLCAVIILAPFILTTPSLGTVYEMINWKTIGATLALSVLSTALLFVLWFKFIKEKGGVWASLVSLSENLSGVILPIIFLNEKLTWPIVIGGLLIVAAVAGKEFVSRASDKIRETALQ